MPLDPHDALQRLEERLEQVAHRVQQLRGYAHETFLLS
jgi:hypothetical protein